MQTFSSNAPNCKEKGVCARNHFAALPELASPLFHLRPVVLASSQTLPRPVPPHPSQEVGKEGERTRGGGGEQGDGEREGRRGEKDSSREREARGGKGKIAK